MGKELYVTVTGINYYFGQKPFEIGRILKLVKDKDNEYDSEAIAVKFPHIGKVGYVANSVNTVIQGTHSAGRLYDKVGKKSFAQVMFITPNSVIAKIIDSAEAKGLLKNDDTETDEDIVRF